MSERKVKVGDVLIIRDRQLVFADTGEPANPPVETIMVASHEDSVICTEMGFPRELIFTKTIRDSREESVLVGWRYAPKGKGFPLTDEPRRMTLVVKWLPMFYTRVETVVLDVAVAGASTTGLSETTAAFRGLERIAREIGQRSRRIHSPQISH